MIILRTLKGYSRLSSRSTKTSYSKSFGDAISTSGGYLYFLSINSKSSRAKVIC